MRCGAAPRWISGVTITTTRFRYFLFFGLTRRRDTAGQQDRPYERAKALIAAGVTIDAKPVGDCCPFKPRGGGLIQSNQPNVSPYALPGGSVAKLANQGDGGTIRCKPPDACAKSRSPSSLARNRASRGAQTALDVGRFSNDSERSMHVPGPPLQL